MSARSDVRSGIVGDRNGAHLDRQRIRKEREEPAESHCWELDAEILEVVRDIGQVPLDEVAKDSLIGLRDEKMRGVVVLGKDFLRAHGVSLRK